MFLSWIKKISVLLIVSLIISPIFFLQSKLVLARENDYKDSDFEDAANGTLAATKKRFAMLVSPRNAQANISDVINTLSVKVYCGISQLFANTCAALNGTDSVQNAEPSDVVNVDGNTTNEFVYNRNENRPEPAVTGAESRQAVIERVVERVTTPFGIAGVSADYVDQRLAELATQLRSEMADRTVTVRSTSRGVDSTTLQRQVDIIYDDMDENIGNAIAGLDILSESEIQALIASSTASVTPGPAGYVLQSTGTTTQWVATSTLGFAGSMDLDALSIVEVGNGNTATTSDSSAFGRNNTVTGQFASALGHSNVVSGNGSSASGYGNHVVGGNAAAFGFQNSASGLHSSALGHANWAAGSYSSASGYNNTASGFRSSAFGYQNNVSATSSSAFGSSIVNDVANSVMIGPSNTAKLTIISSGNVGIGTTTPTTVSGMKLEVVGGIIAGGQIRGRSMSIQNTNPVLNFNPVTEFYDTGGTGLLASTTADTVLGKLSARGVNNNGFLDNAAEILFTQDGSVTSGSAVPGAISFTTGTNSANPVERMRITSSGNLGIGTTTPGYRLSVSGDANITGALRFSGNAGTAGYVLQSTGTGAQWVATSTLGFSGGIDLNNIDPIRVGQANTTVGSSSVAFGHYNTASGTYSVTAIGIFNTASSSYATAIGSDNIVSGMYSTAAGYGNGVTNSYSAAFGYSNSISGSQSSAFGYDNNVSVSGASAFGSNIVNNIANSVMVGPSNTAKLTILSSGNVGVGTTTPDRALVVAGSGFSIANFRTTSTSDRSTGITITNNNTAAEGWDIAVGGVGNGLGFTNGELYMGANSKDFAIRNRTAGGESLRVTSAGNVGIGITNPNTSLYVAGPAGGSAVTFTDSTNGSLRFSFPSPGLDVISGNNGHTIAFGGMDTPGGAFTERMRIVNSTGNIGIGTSTPAAKLDVWGNVQVGTSLTPALFVNASTGRVGINTSSPYAPLNVYSTQDKTALFHRNTTANLQSVGLQMSVLSGFSDLYQKAGIFFQRDDSYLGGFGAGKLIFAVNNTADSSNASTTDARMVILPSGNVGIGTTTPERKLHVVETSALLVPMALQNRSTAGYSGTHFLSSSGATMGHIGYANTSASALADTFYVGSTAAKDMVMTTNGTVRMTITAGGLITTGSNVGIGTTTPYTKLTIAEANSQLVPLVLQNTSSGGYSGIHFLNNTGTLTGHIGYANTAAGSIPDKFYVGSLTAKDLILTTNGAVRMTIASTTGNVGIGTATPTARLDVANGSSSFGTSANALGVSGLTSFTNVETGSYYRPVAMAMDFTAAPVVAPGISTDFHGTDIVLRGSNSNLNSLSRLYAFESTATYAGSGTLGSLYSGYFQGSNTGVGAVNESTALRLWTQNTGNGSIGDARALFIQNPSNTGSGTIANNYGIYIEEMSAATGNNFGIYSIASRNYLAGLTTLKQTINATTSQALVVNQASSPGTDSVVFNINHTANLYPFRVANAGAYGPIFTSATNGGDSFTVRKNGTGNGVAVKFINAGTGNTLEAGPSAVPNFVLTSGGSLGIGTTTPGYKLSVVGDANVTGALRFNGDAGTAGYVLQSTGTGAQWVATSTLGAGSSINLNALTPMEVGNGNTATGTNSVAFGYQNTAGVSYNSAVGVFNTAGAGKTSVFGYFNTASAYYGSVFGSISDVTGNYSTAVGHNVSVSGASAFAGGYFSSAAADQSLALGYSTNAYSVNTTSIGAQNTASGTYATAVGSANAATFLRASAVGSGNDASADFASAFGSMNSASGVYSTAAGYNNDALNQKSAALGFTNTASGDYASATGIFNESSNDYASAFGYANFATGVNSSAFGSGNDANGDSSVAFGYENTASNGFSTAVGTNNTNSGQYSNAFGYFNTVTADNGLVIGHESNVSSSTAMAIGYRSGATSLNSVAIGNRSFAGSNAGQAAVAFGILNNSTGATLNATTGVITGTASATTTIGDLSTAIGILNSARGDQGVAIGYSNIVLDGNGVAIGRGNTVRVATNLGVAIGSGNEVLANVGSAVGNSNSVGAGAAFASAFGYDNDVTGSGSVAFGYGNNANNTNAVAFGRNNTVSSISGNAYGTSNNISTGGSSYAFGSSNTNTANNTFTYGTGITNGVTNSLQIGMSDSAKMSILSTGQFGFGTTSPSSRVTIVGAAGTGTLFTIASSTNASLLTVDFLGRLGIGTTTPTEALSVAGNVNITGSLNMNGDAGQNGYVLQSTGTGAQWVATSTLGFLGLDALNNLGQTALGYRNATTTLGTNATAVGYQNTATGTNSVAVGYQNVGSSMYSVLFGNSNYSSTGTSSVSVGILNNSAGMTFDASSGTMSGTPSATSSVGVFSTTLGVGNVARSNQSTAIGYLNSIHMTGTSARSSVALGYQNTVGSVSAIALGSDNVVNPSSNYGIALGYSNRAESSITIALGYLNTSSAYGGSIAIGRQNSVASSNSIAFGRGNTINNSSAEAVAIGSYHTITSASKSYLFGYNLTGQANRIQFGLDNNNKVTIDDQGWIGVGSSSPSAMIAIRASSSSNTNDYFTVASSTNFRLFTIKSTGNVGIGTSTPGEKLTVAGSAQFTGVGSGAYGFDLNLTADGVLTTSASDERLKKNIEQLNTKDTLDKLMQLKPSTFDWKSNGSHDIGLIAQEVEEIFPELVFTNKTDGFKGVNYSRLPALLIAGIQEINTTFDSFVDYVEDGIAYINEIVVKRFTAKQITVQNEDLYKTGVTIYDQKTGEPICMFVYDGEMKTEPGRCEDREEPEEDDDGQTDGHDDGSDGSGNDGGSDAGTGGQTGDGTQTQPGGDNTGVTGDGTGDAGGTGTVGGTGTPGGDTGTGGGTTPGAGDSGTGSTGSTTGGDQSGTGSPTGDAGGTTGGTSSGGTGQSGDGSSAGSGSSGGAAGGDSSGSSGSTGGSGTSSSGGSSSGSGSGDAGGSGTSGSASGGSSGGTAGGGDAGAGA